MSNFKTKIRFIDAFSSKCEISKYRSRLRNKKYRDLIKILLAKWIIKQNSWAMSQYFDSKMAKAMSIFASSRITIAGVKSNCTFPKKAPPRRRINTRVEIFTIHEFFKLFIFHHLPYSPSAKVYLIFLFDDQYLPSISSFGTELVGNVRASRNA